jgi:hypothetical protein
VSQQAEIQAERWKGAGYERVPDGTLGRSTDAKALLVHVVRWWNPSTVWRQAAAVWLCGNTSHRAEQVSEIPEHLAMCRACTKRSTR